MANTVKAAKMRRGTSAKREALGAGAERRG
jgi:hypothetical protein